MGDISGRPKAPAQQVVYVPQYVYANTPASGTAGSGSQTDNGAEGDTPLTPEQQREKSLLGRSRSRLSTIMTGFRGILAPNEQQDQRKTLLGE